MEQGKLSSGHMIKGLRLFMVESGIVGQAKLLVSGTAGNQNAGSLMESVPSDFPVLTQVEQSGWP